MEKHTNLRTILAAMALAGALLGCQKDHSVAVQGVSLNTSSLSLTIGDEATLTATVTPSDADNKEVSWSSSNPSVATVSSGKVTAVSKGSANITVTTVDGAFTATCLVSVDNVRVSAVSISPSSLLMKVGETQQLTADVTPPNAADKSVTWSSATESIATVSSDGLVTAVASGVTKVTVTTGDGGITSSIEVAVAGLSLSQTEASVYSGYKAELTASMIPGNASASSLNVTSSDEGVATVSVSDDGKIVILGVAEGTATVTVTAIETGLTATCAVTVKASPSGSFGEDDYGKFN